MQTEKTMRNQGVYQQMMEDNKTIDYYDTVGSSLSLWQELTRERMLPWSMERKYWRQTWMLCAGALNSF